MKNQGVSSPMFGPRARYSPYYHRFHGAVDVTVRGGRSRKEILSWNLDQGALTFPTIHLHPILSNFFSSLEKL